MTNTPSSTTSDENRIRNLAGRYARAAMDVDRAAFRALWWEDGVWDDGGTGTVSTGRDAIVDQFGTLLDGQDFFIQLFTGGVVEVEGGTATSRWIVEERARLSDGTPYHNVGYYDDELERRDGEWRYVRRTYRVAWSDDDTPMPGAAATTPAAYDGGA